MSFSIRLVQSQSALQYSLGLSTNSLFKSLHRLSSGYRISSASDGPASLIISEKLRSQIATLNQEIENISANIDKYQYGSSAIMEERSKLTELRSLAVGAANAGGNDPTTQAAYATAAESLVDSYNDVRSNSEYNGSKVLDGSSGSLTNLPMLEDVDLSSAEAAEASIAVIDEAISEVDSAQVQVGATQKNSLESERASLQITTQNLIASESRIRDLDYAAEYVNFVSEMIRMQTSVALMAHSKISGSLVLNLIGS